MISAKSIVSSKVVFHGMSKEAPVALVRINEGGCLVEVTEMNLLAVESTYKDNIRSALVKDGLLPERGPDRETMRLRTDLGYIAIGLNRFGDWTHILFAPAIFNERLTLLTYALINGKSDSNSDLKITTQQGRLEIVYVFSDGGQLVYDFENHCVATIRESDRRRFDPTRKVLIGNAHTTDIVPGRGEKFAFFTPGFMSSLFCLGGEGVEPMQAKAWLERKMSKNSIR